MSDAESLSSEDSFSNPTAPKIISAVKSYLLGKSFGGMPNSRSNEMTPRDSGYIRRLTERSVPTHSGVHTPAIGASIDIDESQLGILRENNQELAYIRDILCQSVPDALNETLLLVIEERSRRERIEAELQAVRDQWKEDVSELRKIIEAKSDTINHLIRLNATDQRNESFSQLEAALSEIERLRTIIQTIR